MINRYYMLGPYENNDRYSIVQEDPRGGDPITLLTIARIHRTNDIYRLIELANRQLEADRSKHLHEMSQATNQGGSNGNI